MALDETIFLTSFPGFIAGSMMHGRTLVELTCD